MRLKLGEGALIQASLEMHDRRVLADQEKHFCLFILFHIGLQFESGKQHFNSCAVARQTLDIYLSSGS